MRIDFREPLLLLIPDIFVACERPCVVGGTNETIELKKQNALDMDFP